MSQKTDRLDWIKPSIHPSYAKLLCAHVRAQGVSMDDLFRGNTITWKELLAKQDFINFAQYRWLLLRAIELSGRPWLGLDISNIIQISAHGSLGYGAVAANSVGDAMNLVERAIATRLQIVSLSMEVKGEFATILVSEKIDLAESREFVYVALLGSMLDLLEKISGTESIDLAVSFPIAKPAWAEQYKKRFSGINIEFDGQQFCVSFPASFLDWPCLTSDEFIYRNALRECDQLLNSGLQLGSLASMVRDHLYENRESFPQEEKVAAHFNMSVRTFIRKLKSERSSFQKILDEVRKDLACWHLQNTEESVEQIAMLLGYIDTSNFSRVFKRWMEITPSQFRKLSQVSA